MHTDFTYKINFISFLLQFLLKKTTKEHMILVCEYLTIKSFKYSQHEKDFSPESIVYSSICTISINTQHVISEISNNNKNYLIVKQ